MRVLAAITALSALTAILAACASSNQRASSPSTPSTPEGGSTPPSSSPSGPDSAPPGDNDPAGQRRILVTIGDEQFEMTLDASAASRDLIEQLPVTLQMQDHGSVEKTGRLAQSLSLEGQPSGADPDVADVGYYAPGNDLVFYYGDQSYYPGIVVLGHMDQGTAQRISNMQGSITARITLPPS
jgi:hypothetical protein